MAQDYVKGLLSSGEVVLIDTRQHWMALIRFALKPILLIGLVVVLILLNQWLDFDGVLSILNDIIQIVLVVAAIAAVIWLPIDVVQWFSYHFVLTNRRSMRMSGVLRKKSYDSSLEQINDIASSQSVLGRTLGYADLTLLTASEAPNETYEQLMDGLQFKKAVLDAKEAIRVGAPLQGLADGFIVKGGTNQASMRADGKLKEAAAAEEASPASTRPIGNDQPSTPFEPVTAEVLAQRSDPGSSGASPAAASGDAYAAAEEQAAREAAEVEPEDTGADEPAETVKAGPEEADESAAEESAADETEDAVEAAPTDDSDAGEDGPSAAWPSADQAAAAEGASAADDDAESGDARKDDPATS